MLHSTTSPAPTTIPFPTRDCATQSDHVLQPVSSQATPGPVKTPPPPRPPLPRRQPTALLNLNLECDDPDILPDNPSQAQAIDPRAARLSLLCPARQPSRRARRHPHLHSPDTPHRHPPPPPPAPHEAHVRPRGRPPPNLQRPARQAPRPPDSPLPALAGPRHGPRLGHRRARPRGRHGLHRGRRDGDRRPLQRPDPRPARDGRPLARRRLRRRPRAHRPHRHAAQDTRRGARAPRPCCRARRQKGGTPLAADWRHSRRLQGRHLGEREGLTVLPRKDFSPMPAMSRQDEDRKRGRGRVQAALLLV